MLAPEYLAGLPDRLVALYAAVEQDILLDMARRIREYDFYIPAAQHQHQRLRAMGLAEEEIEAILSTLSGRSREELRRLMEQAAEKSLAADAAVYAAAGMGPVDPLAAAGVLRVLRSGLAQTGGAFENLTRTTARTAAKQFENALDRAWLQIASGGFDYNTAIRNAIKDLARQGIEAITYPSGHIDTLEVAVRRAVVTGCNQTAAKAQIALMDDLGVDLVETSAHRGARPSHQVWQGQIFSRSGRSGKYPDFVLSTGYGTGAGLCGWNCSHSFGPYIEGAPRAYSPALLEQYSTETVTYNGKELTRYEAGQQQRYIERQIRRWKREYAAMDGAGLDTGEAAAKLSAWRTREKDFCQQTGLKRQGERAQVAARGKRIAKRADSGIMKPSKPKETPKVSKTAAPRRTVTPRDVTKEYLEAATPGQGAVTCDDSYNIKLHETEISFSKWLHNTFGGDIRLLEEINQDKISTPDYLWNGKAWDLKTASTEKSADAAIRHGLRQIKENPGGIFLDYRGKKIDKAVLESVINSRMRHSRLELVDIMAILDDNTVMVFRYKK